MLNWYADQIIEQHNERVRRALKQYAINQALAVPHKPALRTRTFVWIGDHLVRWGHRLQARSNKPSPSLGTYIGNHR